MIADALYKFLTEEDSDAVEVTDFLAEYQGAPAIFTGGLPDDCGLPAIIINEIGGSSDFGTRAARGAALNVDVQLFADKSLSGADVRALAFALWELLNRADLNAHLEHLIECGCVAEPPADTNDGLGFPGYTIRVRVTVLERT